jgi:hypothetical protein
MHHPSAQHQLDDDDLSIFEFAFTQESTEPCATVHIESSEHENPLSPICTMEKLYWPPSYPCVIKISATRPRIHPYTHSRHPHPLRARDNDLSRPLRQHHQLCSRTWTHDCIATLFHFHFSLASGENLVHFTRLPDTLGGFL